MKLLVVPNVLRDNINAALDREIAKHPESAHDRQLFYEEILNFFDEHGYLPEFTIEPRHDTRSND